MNISRNWLSDYIDLGNLTDDDISVTLTNLGIEVEAVVQHSKVQGEVVVGRIVEAKQHPNAENLRCCLVDVGAGEPLEIVCGAPNARAGLVTVVAKVGSTLPGDFKIKKSKIRGETSCGMMCAEDELGLSDNHDSIIELDPSLKIGSDIVPIFKLSDSVFTLSITPNRADAFGYLGVARELSAKLGIPLKNPEISYKASPESKTSSLLKLEIENSSDCPRFCALSVQNISGDAPSPSWLKERLEASGLRSLGLIVDVTNYVMLEYGHPVHAYDRRNLESGILGVRLGRMGEKLTTLDSKVHELTSEDIVITDGRNAVGLAGIMGGLVSEVKKDTVEIIVEVAVFKASRVRKASKRLGIHTDASHRFERGVDIEAARDVCARVAHLLQKNSPDSSVKVSAEILDFYPEPFKHAAIALRASRFSQLTGIHTLTSKQISDYLEGLGIMLLDQTSDGERLVFAPPSWRHDILREVDLIEEVARLHGYEKIPFSLPTLQMEAPFEHPFIRFFEDCKRDFASLGMSETISFPFVSEKDLDSLGISKHPVFSKVVKLKNALNSEEGLMHTTLVPALLKAAGRNASSQSRGARLFETGRGYFSTKPTHSLASIQNSYGCRPTVFTDRALNDPSRVFEYNLLGFVLDQPGRQKNWKTGEGEVDLFEVKSQMLEWCHRIGLRNVVLQRLNFSKDFSEFLPFLHPLNSFVCLADDGKLLGYFGAVHPKTASDYKFEPSQPPVVGEFLLDVVFQVVQASKKEFVPQFLRAEFPSLTRDLCLVMPESLPYAEIEKKLSSVPRKAHLSSVKAFDVYQGKALGEGLKSITLSLQFRSSKKTLTEKDIEFEWAELVKWLTAGDLGVRVRA